MTDVTPATREELLDFCNKVRAAGQAALIDKLMPGVAGARRSCLIARNLNFDCSVYGIVRYISPDQRAHGEPDSPSQWLMESNNPILLNIGNRLGLHTYRDPFAPVYRMDLPPEIGAAARAFDQGQCDKDLYAVEPDEFAIAHSFSLNSLNEYDRN